MRKLVFATHNKNKMREIQSLMPEDIQLLSLDDINCFEDIEETESTIEGNAILKANYIKKKYGYDVFADDTGLEVKALDDQPGVYSARYAGSHKSDADNMQLLLQNMEEKTNREAQFKTVIALCLGDDTHIFEGIIKGTITTAPMGTNGFGYDPVFQPIGFSQTFAQLPLTTKNEISHRGKAFKKLLSFLRKI
ncbi:MAG: non-canonical purine NTP diphosphatase [Capnocytophaga felis]|nr:non-canonical purine NTP diphosphatase [Capnocytophaga felis]